MVFCPCPLPYSYARSDGRAGLAPGLPSSSERVSAFEIGVQGPNVDPRGRRLIEYQLHEVRIRPPASRRVGRLPAARLLGWRAWRRLLGHTDRSDTGEHLPKKRRVRSKVNERLPCAARLGVAVWREEWDGPGGQAKRIGVLDEHIITKSRRRRIQEENGLFDATAAPFLQEFPWNPIQELAVTRRVDEGRFGAPVLFEGRVAFDEVTFGLDRQIGVSAGKWIEIDLAEDGADLVHVKWRRPKLR